MPFSLVDSASELSMTRFCLEDLIQFETGCKVLIISLISSSEVLLRMPLVFAEIRGLSVELATVELTLEASFIDYGTYRSLRREIGEPLDETPPEAIPNWDPTTGQLTFNGELARKVSQRAENARLILDFFEDLGLPSHIDNPLPGGAISGKLRETVRTLNKKLSIIRFYADGKSEGVLWQVDD